MRSPVLIALFGSLLFTAGSSAQSLGEHAAAAAGATIGTAAGKPLSNAITKIFGNADSATSKAAKQGEPAKKEPVKDPAKEPATADKPQVLGTPSAPAASGGSGGSGGGSSYARRSGSYASQGPSSGHSAGVSAEPAVFAAPAIPEPVVKVPTPEEFASVKAGSSDKDMIALLGPPASRLTIPDDDGHLRETCQYWANGKPLGTIRLDNGQVVTVEVRN